MAEENQGEFYILDMNVWEPVKLVRGPNKGEHPVISSNGSVYIDRDRTGEDVRVFIRKRKTL